MHRIQFIHPPPANRKAQRRAVVASILFHGLALTSLLLLTYYYRWRIPLNSGSRASAPVMSLQTMVVSSSEPPPTSTPTPPPVPMPPVPVEITQPLHNSVAPEKVPEIGVPVFLHSPSKPVVAKTEPSHHKSTSHTASQASASATAAASSYAPGENFMPHPPYPEEARSRGQTGTVTVLVEFDGVGKVTSTAIYTSSGVAILDSETSSFIRENWHSAQFAGQSFTVPVKYHLENQ